MALDPAPCLPAERHDGIDALRGFTLLGVCLANLAWLSLYEFLGPQEKAAVAGSGFSEVVGVAMADLWKPAAIPAQPDRRRWIGALREVAPAFRRVSLLPGMISCRPWAGQEANLTAFIHQVPESRRVTMPHPTSHPVETSMKVRHHEAPPAA